MKGTLEKLRRMFISKRRQEDDLSTSKFSRSLSFKKGSMRRSLRRLTRRKALVTNHGIIYVEGDLNSSAAISGPALASLTSAHTAQRPARPSAAANDWPIGSPPPHSHTSATEHAEGNGTQLRGADAGFDAACSQDPPPAADGSAPDHRTTAEVSPDPDEPQSAGTAVTARNATSAGLASSSGSSASLSDGSALRRLRRPTDSLPRPPTQGDPVPDSSRRASHCGVSRAVEAPRTPQLAGRTARIMSASLTHTATHMALPSGHQGATEDLKPSADEATTAGCEGDVAHSNGGGQHGEARERQEEEAGRPPSGGVRRRMPTVLATRDHLRRSLRRLSERRRKSRRPESVADPPTAGLDFYRMFSRVPPVLPPGTSMPSAPFTFSRRNPITQWLAESESEMAARRTPAGSADWDALLWSELVLCPPAGEKEARRRAKRAAKRARRTRTSGWRTSSEASATSGGTAVSGTEVAGKGDPELDVQPNTDVVCSP